MISDKLYRLAFEYKKTKLWKSLWETELFAVKLSDDRIGYISVMGSGGEHLALSLYIGDEGFCSFRRLVKPNAFLLSPLKMHEFCLQQDCMQCSLESKDLLGRDEYEEAKSYARKNGIKIAGKNAYPMFRKYLPNRIPWPLQAEKDQEDLCEALAAAIELSRLLKEKKKAALGLEELKDGTKEIPLLEYRDNGYVLGKTPIPPEQPQKVPEPKISNDIALASLKKMKRTGVWECEIIRFPQPIQNTPDEIPFFPVLLLAVEASDGYLLQVEPVEHYEEHPEELLNQFVDALIQEEICPLKIKAHDERTYAFAKSLCKKLKIAIEIEEDLPALEEAEEEFLEHFDMTEEEQMDELDNILYDILNTADGRQIDSLPDELLQILEVLGNQEIPGGNIIDLTKDRKLSKIPPKQIGPDQSFVISVSLGSGCYRHIRISGNSTLFELHYTILEAFDFDDDHAHAFFMDNALWSDRDSYYVRGMESPDRTTDAYTLNQAGLCKGKKFKYLFDFGDEWVFQCKVLQVLEEDTTQAKIVKRKGKAPEQYPDWEEDEDWD